MNAQTPSHGRQYESAGHRSETAALGMWVFLATELMFFGPLFFGYAYGRLHFPEGFAAASRHTDVALGTINTAILLTSSLLVALAVHASRAGAMRLAARLLFLTVVLGICFLAVKGIEYRHEWQEHLFPGAGFAFPEQAHAEAARLFYFLYFGTTALHALHLAIGIALVGMFAVGTALGAQRFARAERIEVAALYWHFVDVVWIFLYPILYLVGRSG